MKLLNKHTVRFCDGNVFEFYTSYRFDPRDLVWHYVRMSYNRADVIYTKYGIEQTDKEVRRLKRAGVYLSWQRETLFCPAKSNEMLVELLDDIMD